MIVAIARKAAAVFFFEKINGGSKIYLIKYDFSVADIKNTGVIQLIIIKVNLLCFP